MRMRKLGTRTARMSHARAYRISRKDMDLAARTYVRITSHVIRSFFDACTDLERATASYMQGAWQTKVACELGIACSWP